jgi:cytochrome c oxidase subunit 2
MNASNFVEGVDFTMYLILGISVFFLIGITALMVYFLFRYRAKKNPVATNIAHNNKLEVIWTVIPTLLVLVMFYFGWAGYKPMLRAPKGAMEIEAIGQMWKWTFVYPDGKVSDSLVVPLDEPVKLNLVSKDVNHALYIPAFRVKQDVTPGVNNMMWFTAQKEGTFDLFCAEYCGQLHSYMLTNVTVMEKNGFDNWLVSEPDLSDEHPGLTVLKKNACLSCHSQDGTRLVGPTFKGLIGRSEVVLIDGQEAEIVVDRDYIIESIKYPNAAIVEGYQQGLMISYEATITDEEIDQIIDYLSTVK